MGRSVGEIPYRCRNLISAPSPARITSFAGCSGGPGAHLFRVPPPPRIQRRPIKSPGFQLVKGITGQCFPCCWSSALAPFATHFNLCLREKAGRRGFLPTRRSGGPDGEQALLRHLAGHVGFYLTNKMCLLYSPLPPPPPVFKT